MKKFAAAALALLFVSGCAGITAPCGKEVMTKDGPVCEGTGHG